MRADQSARSSRIDRKGGHVVGGGFGDVDEPLGPGPGPSAIVRDPESLRRSANALGAIQVVRITRINRYPERTVDVARGGVSHHVGITEPSPGRASVGALPDPALIDRGVDGVWVLGIEVDAVDSEGVGEIGTGRGDVFPDPGGEHRGRADRPAATERTTVPAPHDDRSSVAANRAARRTGAAAAGTALPAAPPVPGAPPVPPVESAPPAPARTEPPAELLPPPPAFVAEPPVPGLTLPASFPSSSGGIGALSPQPDDRARESAARPRDIVVLIFTSSRMPRPSWPT